MKHKINMLFVSDCVHTLIKIPDYAEVVIAMAIFQRLGRVKQTGSLSFVWPSAVQTRLEHSIGCMHLAMVYADHLKLGERRTKVFVLASLLHDIAHGPFSHVFEKAIRDTAAEDMFGNHDLFRFRLLRENRELKTLGPTMIEEIINVWTGKDPLLYELLAGPAGVDRMDYLLRDSYHILPYRKLDLSCVMGIIYNTVLEGNTIVLTRKYITLVSDFLSVRRYMYAHVYSHKGGVIASNLIKQALPHIMDKIVPYLTPDLFERLDDGYLLSLAWGEGKGAEYLLRYIRGHHDTLVRVDTEEESDTIFRKTMYGDCSPELQAHIMKTNMDTNIEIFWKTIPRC